MKLFNTMAFAAIMGAGALALTASQASARIVCNGEGDCWHQQQAFEFPMGVGVVVHPDGWKWKEGEKHAWREHDGRGYWHGGAWMKVD